MENKLELRVGDVVLLRVKVNSIPSKEASMFHGEVFWTKHNVEFYLNDVNSVIERPETDAEKIARLEAELAKAPRRIEWGGGDCPVDPDSKVLVYLASNIIDCGKAKYFTWGSLQDHDNIIAYMVLPS